MHQEIQDDWESMTCSNRMYGKANGLLTSQFLDASYFFNRAESIEGIEKLTGQAFESSWISSVALASLDEKTLVKAFWLVISRWRHSTSRRRRSTSWLWLGGSILRESGLFLSIMM
ncbi:hypothetical protein M6B38_166125 [Iris pallida]|uniref:Uncharacterized protein n=1 Tax=Iris pallida TaxID=29817 RepID=A0AAX6EXP7_IRIPA|nr:hypothetical protein M6B38_166125 [Iris pallida]